MDVFKGTFSNKSSKRESRRSSPYRSRGTIIERPQFDNVVINSDPFDDIYLNDLFTMEEFQIEKEKGAKEVTRACDNCNISHILGQCPVDVEENISQPSALPLVDFQESTVKQVRRVVKLNELLNKNGIVNGDKVAHILTEFCDNILHNKASSIQRDFMEMITKGFRETNNTLAKIEASKKEIDHRLYALKDIELKLDPRIPFTTNIAHIPLPDGLILDEEGELNLDRLLKLERFFKNVEIYNNRDVSVREFLSSVVSIVSVCANCIGITEKEYKTILWNKLGPSVQTTLSNSGQIKDALSLHKELILFFDLSESPQAAMVKLQNLRPSDEINTVQKFLGESLRLIQLIDNSSNEEKAHIFGIALRNFLPDRLEKKLNDEFIRHMTLFGKQPSLVFLIHFIKSYRSELEETTFKT